MTEHADLACPRSSFTDERASAESTSVPLRARGMRSSATSRWAPLLVLMAGTFMIVMDFFVVNVAYPSIQAGLHASAGSIEWVIAGYGLTYASFLITAGRIGDHIGRRRVLITGLLLFTLASIACGAAPGPALLITARLVQGAAAAMISPSVLAILGVIYRGPDRARAISAYGLTLGLAALAAQLTGGLLIQWDIAGLGWRTIFLINVPVGAAALALVRRIVPENRAQHATRLDVAGMSLVTLGLTATVLPLVEGPQLGWPAWTWISLGLAVPLLLSFFTQQSWLARRGGNPLISPELFSHRSLRAGLATQLALWCSMASFFLVLTLYLQHGRGLSALHAGTVFTILAAPFVAASLRAPALTVQYGRAVIAAGALTLAAGFGLLVATVGVIGTAGPVWALAPGLLLVGAGQGLSITPLTAIVLSHSGPEHAGAVSGVLSTMQQVGNALGVAVTGVIFFTALHAGYPHAFAASLVELTCLAVAVASLTALLPGHRGALRGTERCSDQPTS